MIICLMLPCPECEKKVSVPYEVVPGDPGDRDGNPPTDTEVQPGTLPKICPGCRYPLEDDPNFTAEVEGRLEEEDWEELVAEARSHTMAKEEE